MTVETAPFINGLNSASPGPSDLKSEGDDQIRLLKSAIQATFPNITGAITPTQTAINQFFATTTADGNGQIGINPTVDSITGLQVSRPTGNGNAGINMVVQSYAQLSLGVNNLTGSNSVGAPAGSTYIYTGQNIPMVFGVNSIERMRLTSSSAVFANAVTAPTFNGYLATGNISQFTNDSGYITSIGTLSSLSVSGLGSFGGAAIAPGSGSAAINITRANQATGGSIINFVTTGGATWQFFTQTGGVDLGLYNTAFGNNVATFSQTTGNVTFANTVNATTFVGALNGNATSATTAGTASNATFATTASNANNATTALSVSGVLSNGYGNRTVSSSAPSGGVDGDIWFQTMTGIFVHVSGSWLRVL